MSEETFIPVENLHKPNTVLRVAAAANVVSWLILLIYLYFFVTNLVSIFSAPGAFPQQISDQISLVLQILLQLPLMGAFYFLVLQSVSHLLYLGTDIFDNLTEEIEIE